MASGVSDDQQAELVRLRRELLSFVVADLAQVQPDGQAHPLTGKIAAAIASEANSATQAELRQSAERLAGAVIDALEPHLAARIPAIVEPAVAAALAVHEATAARRVPDWMLWAMLAINVAAIAVTGLVLAA
ncbi:hypothetical protein [Sandarakinorhabdus sp.]|jgi:hypothetical protein|uniref:hypothetical protein n=1 Tax=Sandarakinorhabdus sp. TaxID=1916663 RepID=UPI00333FB2B2